MFHQEKLPSDYFFFDFKQVEILIDDSHTLDSII